MFVKMTARERERYSDFGVVDWKDSYELAYIYASLAYLFFIFLFLFFSLILNYLFYLLGMNWNLESIMIGFLKLSSFVGPVGGHV